MNPKKISEETISLEQSKAILNGLLDGVIIVDLQGIILFANAVCSKLFGKNVDQLIGQHFGFPIEVNLRQEIEIENSKGSRQILQLLSNKIVWGNKKVYLLSLRDITTQKELALKLEKTHQELEKSFIELTNANKDLENFNSMVVHDLKAPLRNIAGFSSLLIMNSSKQLDKDAKDHLEFIIKASNRMSVLIDDLLSLSSITHYPGELIECNINELLAELLETLRPSISETGGKIQVGKLGKIRGVPGLMKQVFQNLILNSLKFRRQNTIPVIKISGKKQDNIYQIVFEDNGIGFDDKYSQQIFESFKRLENSDQYLGSGIGLSIVKKIMDIHHGMITAESKIGKGSRFILKFPL